jgi:hypothetical protein
MEPDQGPVPLRNYLIVLGMAVALGAAAWYVFSNLPYTPSRDSIRAQIEQQHGIQSLVCDPSNLQHFNSDECERSKELERLLKEGIIFDYDHKLGSSNHSSK